MCCNGCPLAGCAVRGSTPTLTDLAGFAGAAPGRAQRGAALGLERGSVDVDLAAVVLDRQPAGALHAVCGATATKVEHVRESNPMELRPARLRLGLPFSHSVS